MILYFSCSTLSHSPVVVTVQVGAGGSSCGVVGPCAIIGNSGRGLGESHSMEAVVLGDHSSWVSLQWCQRLLGEAIWVVTAGISFVGVCSMK